MSLIASTLPVILPTIFGTPQCVLDIGCGNGRTLAALGLNGCRSVALDIDFNVLQRSERRDQGHLVCGAGEALPFRDRCFDLVISKVALPYMNIPSALREINRVMKLGAQLFLTLHRFDMAWHRILGDLRVLRFRDAINQLYAILNGSSLAWFGVQFRWPPNRSRCQSVQGARAMQKALHRAGFDEIATEMRGTVFAVGARKSRTEAQPERTPGM